MNEVVAVSIADEPYHLPSYENCEPISPENAPSVLSWRDLVVTTKVSKAKVQKQLLNNLSGSITGGLWAIMGSSGSGKTTFLSCLAMRLDSYRMGISGDVFLNGKTYSKHILKSMSGYVMQDDLVHAHLTVGETLSYAARLRMPRTTSVADRELAQEHVMQLMGISYCRDVLVGDSRIKGISGGERKRLCIALELLTKPQLLFLDEPTSGLDSSTALSVMMTLKHLASTGECTVVTTIHQPSSKIFATFDNLMLMKKGDIVYQGNAVRALDYFEKLGFPCPAYTNPADHLIDIIADPEDYSIHDTDGDDDTKKKQCPNKKFIVPLDSDFGSTKPSFNVKEWQPWYYQFIVLLQRNLHHHMRRWDIIAMNICVTIIIAVFVGSSVWHNIGFGKAGGGKRQPALFFCVIHQGIVSSLQGSHSFPLERSIMLRERAAGTYYVSAYFFAKTVADMTVQIISPVLFTVIAYPLIGFQNDGTHFMRFMSFMILDSFAATSLANMISCIFVSIELSTVVLACAYEWVRLFGGWFISPALMATYPEWKFADALSYIKYAFIAVSLNEDDGLVLHCLQKERTPPTSIGAETFANCKIPPLVSYPYTGASYNSLYGYDHYTIEFCAGMLITYIIVCRLLAYLGLRFIKI